MPLNEQEFAALDAVHAEQPNPRTVLESASFQTPEKYAESLKLARETGAPTAYVHDNLDEVKRQRRVESADIATLQTSNPGLTSYLGNHDNAAISLDDIVNLKAIEDNEIQFKRTWGQFAQDSAIDIGKGIIGLGEGAVGIADFFTLNQAGNALSMIGYDPEKSKDILSEFYSGKRKNVNRKLAEAKGFFNTIETALKNPSTAILGTTLESAPMTIGGLSVARVVASRLLAGAGIKQGTQEAANFLARPDVIGKITTASGIAEGGITAGIIQEQLRAEGKSYTESAPYSIAAGVTTALITRMSSKILPDVEATTAAATLGATDKTTLLNAGKEIAKSFFKEGVLEELPQEMQEQVWQNLAEGKPWSEGVPESGAMALFSGGLTGAAMTGSTQTMSLLSRTERDTMNAVKSISEQSYLDQVIKYSQQSATRNLSPEKFNEFIDRIGADRDVLIPVDVAEKMDGAPDYIVSQLNELDVNIAVPLRRFATDIVANDAWMSVIRPHIKLSESSMSQTEMDAGQSSEISTLMERAKESQETLTQAEKIFETVKEQLVATGVQSEETARYSAQLYPAAATVYAEKARKLGHDVSLEDVFNMMGFRVERGDIGQQVPRGTIVNQSATGVDQTLIPDDLEITLTSPVNPDKSETVNAKQHIADIESNVAAYSADNIDGLSDAERALFHEALAQNELNMTPEEAKAATIKSRLNMLNFAAKDATQVIAEALGKTPEFLRKQAGAGDVQDNATGRMFTEKQLFQTADQTKADMQEQQEQSAPVKQADTSFEYKGTREEIRNAIRDNADKLAERLNAEGFEATVEYSGSLAGPSSYVSVFDPQTNKYIKDPARFSNHGKGPFNDQFVHNMASQRDVEAFVALARSLRGASPAKQTDTQEFKKWFGDSVVTVDGKPGSEPLVVYHSSLADINQFDRHGKYMGYAGVSGISVTDNPELASRYLDRYAEYGWVDGEPNKPFSKNIIPLYVRVLNPLFIDKPIKNEYGLGRPIPDSYISDAEKQGYDAVIINDSVSRGGGVKHSDAKNAIRGREIIVFSPTQVKSAIGNRGTFDPNNPSILEQADKTGERASIQFTLDGESIIRLARASDLSSFLHESGHLFLEMEKRFADKFGVTEEQQTLLDWLGVKSFDEVGVEEQEKFAETFEVYLREGKAPSLKLRDAFAAFARWLTVIYRKLIDPRLGRANLTPEIREYMDRMLATEEEIEQATATPAYDQLFKSKQQAGMTDEEWDRYQRQHQRARNAATMDLNQKLIDELKKRKTKEWADERALMIDEEMQRLADNPVYKVLASTAEIPMNREALKEIIGIDRIPPQLNGRTVKGDGADPAYVAETNGYESVAAMYNDIIATPKLKDAAFHAAEERMIEKYGDMLNDGRIELEAREAVHNEEQAKLLIEEIRALSRTKPAINREYLKAEAKRIIGGMKFREMRPDKFYRAEIRAAQKAAMAESNEVKLAAKIQQLANHYLYKEAVEARANMKKYWRHIRKVPTREYKASDVAPDFSQNMRTLANLYEPSNKNNQVRDVTSILEWYEAQLNDPNRFVEVSLLDENLVLALNAKQEGKLANLVLPTFDDMTVDGLRGVYDMLRHLRYVGGQMTDEAKAELRARRESLVQSIIANGGKDKGRQKGVPRDGDSTRRQIQHMINKLPSLRNLIRKLDGFDENGLAFDMIYRLVKSGNNEKLKLHREVYDRFESELGAIHKAGLDRKVTEFKLESGQTISLHSEAVFMMGVYWGTETSRDAIREGFGVTDTDVERILSTLTNEQIDLVNAVWKVNETMWEPLSKAGVALFGVAPPKLSPTPFEINGKAMTGGHMRLFYDSRELELREEGQQMQAMGKIMPTKAGSLIARIGSGGRPPLLDRNNIVRAIEDSVHYIAFAEPSNRLRAILNNKEVRAAIEQKHGEGYHAALIEAVSGITTNIHARESIPALAAMMRLLRRAATFKALAYSIRNSVQQFSAIPVAMEEVGIGAWTSHLLRFTSNHDEFIKFVAERSEEMRNRASLVNREAAEYLRKMTAQSGPGHLWDVFARYGFAPQTFIDSIVAFPVWMSRYEKSMNEHGDESRAVIEADDAVAISVGSGSDLHLGGIFHSSQSEFVRTFTLFGTWFNAYYQRMYRATRGGATMRDFATLEAAKAILMTPMIVGTLAALLVADFPDKDDDENWLIWEAKVYGSFMAGTVPILRDIVGAFSGFSPKTVFSGGAEAPSRFIREIMSYSEGKQTGLKLVSDLTKVTTALIPVPGISNMTRVMDYVDSYNRGKEGEFKMYQAVVKGPTR